MRMPIRTSVPAPTAASSGAWDKSWPDGCHSDNNPMAFATLPLLSYSHFYYHDSSVNALHEIHSVVPIENVVFNIRLK